MLQIFIYPRAVNNLNLSEMHRGWIENEIVLPEQTLTEVLISISINFSYA